MPTMQTKILEAIEQTATAAGLDCVNNSDYANTGHLLVQSGFATLIDVDYAFMPTCARIRLTGPLVERFDAKDYGALRIRNAIVYHALTYATDTDRLYALQRLITDALRAAVADRPRTFAVFVGGHKVASFLADELSADSVSVAIEREDGHLLVGVEVDAQSATVGHWPDGEQWSEIRRLAPVKKTA
ncbi:hypothetical protein GCM10010156_49810 [Planobispora rosea]|uniref:Uncharacterized protein n=1 Tax=Planobispora rosea TaxID=35762 RepID=A0A8J3WF45_PLARO|nr:hypothetical protein [Planobispora rosea]GGS85231.1 hypothetical protein GCM10010156_49810 [Planobispora rosea]GIH86492.1 hypothetical protein Pro02_49000 [Planobispora rosea]